MAEPSLQIDQRIARIEEAIIALAQPMKPTVDEIKRILLVPQINTNEPEDS